MDNNSAKQALLVISGRVQGVFYRAHAQKEAITLGLTGHAKNLPNGNVEVLLQGPESQIQNFIKWAHDGSPGAHVDKIEITWQKIKQKFTKFETF